MKSPAPKIHLLDVSDPLVCFNGLKVRCGIELAHATTVYMFGEGATQDDISPRLWQQTCKNCWNLPPATQDEKRKYVYGLVNTTENLD